MSILNMSGVNISFEIDSGGGEHKYFDKSSIKSKEKSSYASIIAGEIVNEILENALDIATKASDTGINWREIKDSRSNIKIAMTSPLNNSNDSKAEEINQNDELPSNNVCGDIIGDIIDNAGITPSPNISDIIESLNNINQDNDKRCMVPLEVEMKKLLSEILAPPYEIIDYECVPLKGGIGDQPSIESSQKVIEECIPIPEIARPSVEKKSRVTDLVKNSPQIINEYLNEDITLRKRKEDWEENEELLVNVIELDCIEPGDTPFKVPRKYFPELIPLPYDNDEDEILKMHNDEKMNIINSSELQDSKQQLTFHNNMGDLAKGDEQKLSNKNVVTINEIITENVNGSKEKLSLTSKNIQVKKSKKKKWNLGNRIWRFFKRGRKQEELQSCSSST